VNVSITNPLADKRWDDLVARHPGASAFHHRGWLEALSRTYGYQPFLLSNAPESAPSLTDGIVFCRVSSWLTGTRLVSLPFADHCNPLLSENTQLSEFAPWLRAECERLNYKYVELRPLSAQAADGLQPGASFYFHELDLRLSLDRIFEGFHKDSIQRKIQRAEREGLVYEAGRSLQLVDEFYHLLLITRRRHQLLPQPRSWFKNLLAGMGDTITVRVAKKDSVPVAAMITLRHRTAAIYKYGCSDEKFHNLGGVPFLFWKLIEESKASGAETLDFGRTDLDHDGLLVFKDKFGAQRKKLTYYRYVNREKTGSAVRWDSQVVRRLFCTLPNPAFSAAGKLLYRHMG